MIERICTETDVLMHRLIASPKDLWLIGHDDQEHTVIVTGYDERFSQGARQQMSSLIPLNGAIITEENLTHLYPYFNTVSEYIKEKVLVLMNKILLQALLSKEEFFSDAAIFSPTENKFGISAMRQGQCFCLRSLHYDDGRPMSLVIDDKVVISVDTM